jgi:hypothetical protein
MAVHEDTMPEDTELVFINAINTLAFRYDCKITNLDFENRIIEIDGPKNQQAKLASKIADIMSQWRD